MKLKIMVVATESSELLASAEIDGRSPADASAMVEAAIDEADRLSLPVLLVDGEPREDA